MGDASFFILGEAAWSRQKGRGGQKTIAGPNLSEVNHPPIP